MAAEAAVERVDVRSAWDVSGALRAVLMVVPPLLLAVLEVFHPRPDETAQGVMDVATWFLGFHLIQLVLIGLVALSVLLLADEFGRAMSWAVRLGVGTFLVFYSAYDAVAGIGTGLAMRSARELEAVQQDGVFDVVENWPGTDPVVFPLAIVGTLGWVVAIGAIALGARRAGAPAVQWVFIALAGLFLLGGHPFPFGTLAFGSLFVAALLVVVGVPRSARAAS
jgi:hypothetical protein